MSVVRDLGRYRPYPAYRDSGVEWLGEVPEGWEVRRLKRVVSLSRERNGSAPNGEMLAVSGYRGVELKEYDHDARRRSGEELAEYRVVHRGQLVVNTMWLNHSGLGVSDFEGHVSPAYRAYWVGSASAPSYLHHLVRSSVYVEHYCSLLYGIRPNSYQVKPADFDSVEILLPPLLEQHAIAAFLDRETTKIDVLVEKKERLLELLDEQRAALISRAVTKGLDPDVPRKDSGVEWLGEVPEGWEVVRLMRVTEPGRPIMYGIVLPGPNVADGVPIVKGGDVGRGTLGPDTLNRTTYEIEAGYARSRLRGGDLVYSIRGSIGEVAVVPAALTGANLTQDAARVSPGPGVDGSWLLYALGARPVFAQLDAGASGATIRGINIRDLKRVTIPLPPLPEQKAIAAYLDRETARIDALKAKVQHAIDLLKEYRTALISAAVTGQIDVRDRVPEDAA